MHVDDGRNQASTKLVYDPNVWRICDGRARVCIVVLWLATCRLFLLRRKLTHPLLHCNMTACVRGVLAAHHKMMLAVPEVWSFLNDMRGCHRRCPNRFAARTLSSIVVCFCLVMTVFFRIMYCDRSRGRILYAHKQTCPIALS